MRILCSCLKSHFATRLLPLLICVGDAYTALIPEPYAFHTMAETSRPTGIALDSAGNIYAVESTHNRIRKISANGSTLILAGPNDIVEGTSSRGFADGFGSSARFRFSAVSPDQPPYPGGGIAVD